MTIPTDPRSLLYHPDQLDPETAQTLARETLSRCDDGELFLQFTASESFSFDDGRLRTADYSREAGFGLLCDLSVNDTPVATPETEARVAELSAHGARPVGEIVDGLDLDAQRALQAVLVQLIKGNLMAVRDEADGAAAREGTRAFNAVAKHHLSAGRRLLPGLASPETGGVVIVPKPLQRAGFGLETGDAAQIARMQALGLTL